MTMRAMFPEDDKSCDLLAEAASRLALSLIGQVRYCGGEICTSCRMQAYGGDAINHLPDCLVGQVLKAAAARPERIECKGCSTVGAGMPLGLPVVIHDEDCPVARFLREIPPPPAVMTTQRRDEVE